MEFFGTFDNSPFDGEHLKTLLSIARLPELCGSITSLLADQGNSGRIYCVWGEFAVNREELKHGVRFTLPGCPNALAWSVTTDPGCKTTVVHCSINKAEHDEEFIETIREFVRDWLRGLHQSSGLDRSLTADTR
jgi:hypothetical protein